VTRYSVVGLGKLGASMAAAIASRGFDVIGVDVAEEAVDALNQGRAPVQETGLAELITEHRERLRATTSHVEAIAASDVTFVVVPTPSEESGSFSLDYATAALRDIAGALAEKDEYHLVVVTSTVLPGSTRHGLLPILESTGKSCGSDFGLCYSPEFIALGSVIHDFLNPDFLLIGESDRQAGLALENTYREIVLNGAACCRMSFENAELTKIALNAYVTTKITFANMLAELCEHIPGGDVDIVSDALGLDSRIGRKYLTGGLGFGGPCFPRDNLALAHFARSMGASAALPTATQEVNDGLADRIVERLAAFLRPEDTVGVLGLAYKPFSHVVEASQGMEIARRFAEGGFSVVAYDPLAASTARADFAGGVEIVGAVGDVLRMADAVVIATADPEFEQIRASDVQVHGVTIVVDCWRLLAEHLADVPSIQYLPVGRSAADQHNTAVLRNLWSTMEPSARSGGRLHLRES